MSEPSPPSLSFNFPLPSETFSFGRADHAAVPDSLKQRVEVAALAGAVTTLHASQATVLAAGLTDEGMPLVRVEKTGLFAGFDWLEPGADEDAPSASFLAALRAGSATTQARMIVAYGRALAAPSAAVVVGLESAGTDGNSLGEAGAMLSGRHGIGSFFSNALSNLEIDCDWEIPCEVAVEAEAVSLIRRNWCGVMACFNALSDLQRGETRSTPGDAPWAKHIEIDPVTVEKATELWRFALEMEPGTFAGDFFFGSNR